MADVKDPQKLVDDIAKQENAEDAAIIPNAVRGVKDFVKKAAKEIFKTDSEAFEEYRQAKMKEREAKQQPPKPEPVKKASGGKVKSASARADGCAIRGKTRA